MARNARPLDIFPITTRTLEVLRVSDVTPGMRRITLGGPQLAAHTAENGFAVNAFRSDGFDDEFKILLKHPDAAVALGPTQADGLLNWPRGDEHLVMRTYTVRRWDPEAGEIDVDFVVHGLGPATSWACSVQPGESMQIAGPKLSAGHPIDVDWTLIAGDETALPAIGRWLEQWPHGARAQVFIEVAEASHEQALVHPAGVEITWLNRAGAEAGTTSLLFDAIRAAEWWEGRAFAWVAGEALTLAPIRRWLRSERGLEKDQLDITGYWRKQKVVVAADDATRVDLDATEDDGEALHELSEIVPGFAIRVAATIGLADAFNNADCSVAELAEATGASEPGLSHLLRYLEAIRVVEFAGADADNDSETPRYRLTDLGRGLEDEHFAGHLDLNSAGAQREIAAMLSLLEAVQSNTAQQSSQAVRSSDAGRSDNTEHAEPTFVTRLRHDPALLADRLEHDAEDGVYVTGALANTVSFDGSARLVVAGIDPGGFADALVQHYSKLQATIVGTPSEIELLKGLRRPHERVSYVVGSLFHPLQNQADTILLADALRELPDADAVHVLRQAAASLDSGGRLLLFSESLDHTIAQEHDYEEDLVLFALHRSGLRTHHEHLELFDAAGLPAPHHQTIGWGYSLYSVTDVTSVAPGYSRAPVGAR